jgi:RNA polymerase sigma factor (sigma-70 family)
MAWYEILGWSVSGLPHWRKPRPKSYCGGLNRRQGCQKRAAGALSPIRGSQAISASTPDPALAITPTIEQGNIEGSSDESAAETVARLYREHHESLRRFLRARLPPHEAEEVAQEAYVRLLGLRDASTLSFLHALLYRTAANLATDRLRQRTRRQRLDSLVLIETEQPRSPEHESVAEQELVLIGRALEELPEACRKAFVLVNFEELSFDEAAKRLQLHPRRVRRFVARAMEHCHRVVYEDDKHEEGSK